MDNNGEDLSFVPEDAVAPSDAGSGGFDKRRAKLNVSVSILCKIVLLILSLLSKRFLIQYAGDAYNGINSLFYSIVSFLAVADLGIGSAIVYCMYDPIVKNEIHKVRQLYTLFKSDSACGIGAAVADVPTGPFKDHGAVLTATSSGLLGVRDPGFLADDGTNYLVFGHSKGIYLLKLSADGLSPEGLPVKIASEAFDAPALIKRDGKYFLFVSMGTANAGASSNCITVAGRADRPEGPYFDKEGNDLLYGGGETLVATGIKFAGPGHGTVVSLPDGSDWMIYNAYDLSDVAKGRTLMLDRIVWSGGWPTIRGAISSFCTDAPAL